MTDEQKRLRTIADDLATQARERGVDNVIVVLGTNNPSGSHHTTWSGFGLALRGLLELALDAIRRAADRNHADDPPRES